MANQPKQKPTTKKHLARAEREARLTRIILITTAIVLIIAIGLPLAGWAAITYYQTQIVSNQVIASVDDEAIRVGDFQTRVRYQRSQLIDQYTSSVISFQQFSGDPNLVQFMNNSLSQIDIQLENASFLGQEVLDQMIEDELIWREAEARGITISEQDIDTALEEALGFFADGIPEPSTPPEPRPTSTLTSQQKRLVTPQPTAEELPTAVPTPTVEEGASVDAVPTATPFTRQAYEEQLALVLENFAAIGFDEENLRDLIAFQLVSEELFEVVTADTPRGQEQVWARHILLGDEVTALEVIERLDDGEDWSDLASELSLDESNKELGGDLGWFGEGRMVPEFESEAFGLEIGEISGPVETQFGFHVIQVLGREERDLSETEYNQARQQVFAEWVEDLRGDAVIVIVDGWESRVPDEPVIPIQVRQAAQQLLSGAMQPAQELPSDGGEEGDAGQSP